MQTLNNQTDRVTLTNEVAAVFRQTLTRLGFCHRTAEGDLWQVAFKDIGHYPPGDAAVLVVDVHRLPRKVTTLALADQVVIHEFSTAVGGYPAMSRTAAIATRWRPFRLGTRSPTKRRRTPSC